MSFLHHFRRIHYAWFVVAVTFLTLLASSGVRSTPGVLLIPLEREFGWNRAAVSFAVSINLLLYGIGGPFAAAFMERFGVRRVMLFSLSVVAASVSLTALMNATWQLDLLWGVFVGCGTGAMATVLGATVANRWFVKRRGLVLGMLSASSGTGQLIFLPVLAALVVGVGWRAGVLLVAGVALLVGVLVAFLMRDRPSDLGLDAFGADPLAPPAPLPTRANPIGVALGTLKLGLRSRDFWFLAGSFFLCGLTTNGLIGTHLIPAAMEHGIPEVAAAGLLATMGVCDLVGTTASGWLSDRFDSRLLLVWYYSLRGLSLLFLPYALGSFSEGLLIFALFYGLDWLATVPPTVRLATATFGPRQGTVIFGWIFTAHQMGAATAALGAGIIRTWLGDYQAAFMAGGLLCLVAAGLVIRIGRTATPRPARLELSPQPTS